MKFGTIHKQLRGVPFITLEQAQALYDHVLKHETKECLELGFAHGSSSCYIAAALDELGEGHLTTVDLERARAWFGSPSIEDLLQRTGLSRYVTVAREKLSYTWFLKKKIEEQTKDGNCTALYDFCYVDGAHNWTNDGLAFFLVDKLLREDGWILFDDLTWSYAKASPASRAKVEECGVFVSQMDEDQRTAPHIGLVFDLLVKQHERYGNFVIQDDTWGWAQKMREPKKMVTYVETPRAASSRLREWQSRVGRKFRS